MHIGAFEMIEPLPELKEPHIFAMLRPWIDVGSVGHVTLSRLEKHLHAKELGKLARPGTFYDFTRYRPTINVVQGERKITIPNTHILYAERDQAPDFVFLHMLEPQHFGEDFCESVVQVIQALSVKRYCQIGSMYDAVPHTRPLLVSGAAPQGQNLKVPVQRSSYQGPTAITFLISQSAQALGIETMSFIVHLPQYVQLEEDLTGATRLLESLCQLYDLPASIVQQDLGQRQYERISAAVEENSQLRGIIHQLEKTYDATTTEQTNLSPEVENFLREMGKRLDEGQG